MIGRYRVKKDAVDSIWYVELRTMWRVGKLDWVIVETFKSKQDAEYYLKGII